MKYFTLMTKYSNFKSFSNLILDPTFGDYSKLASMSSATCKDSKRKRDCRNIGNAERRLNNLTNVWKYVVFASPHSTFYVNTLEFVPKVKFHWLKMQWETNISFRLLVKFSPNIEHVETILSDTLVKTTKQPCVRSMYSIFQF